MVEHFGVDQHCVGSRRQCLVDQHLGISTLICWFRVVFTAAPSRGTAKQRLEVLQGVLNARTCDHVAWRPTPHVGVDPRTPQASGRDATSGKTAAIASSTVPPRFFGDADEHLPDCGWTLLDPRSQQVVNGQGSHGYFFTSVATTCTGLARVSRMGERFCTASVSSGSHVGPRRSGTRRAH